MRAVPPILWSGTVSATESESGRGVQAAWPPGPGTARGRGDRPLLVTETDAAAGAAAGTDMRADTEPEQLWSGGRAPDFA